MVILMLSSTKFAQKKIEKQVNVKTTPAKMNPIIYLLGGIVPTIGQKEYDFAKKYCVSYHDFGGLAPTNLEKYEALNGTTFELLNIQFGPKWQTEINPNTLGFAKWKENNK
jgi:hypothetical protein